MDNNLRTRILVLFVLLFAISCGSDSDDYDDTNLRLVSVSGNTVTIAWDSVQQAARYNIYRNDVLINAVVAHIYVDNALPAGTYRYQISAVRQGDLQEGEKSNTVTVTVN